MAFHSPHNGSCCSALSSARSPRCFSLSSIRLSRVSIIVTMAKHQLIHRIRLGLPIRVGRFASDGCRYLHASMHAVCIKGRLRQRTRASRIHDEHHDTAWRYFWHCHHDNRRQSRAAVSSCGDGHRVARYAKFDSNADSESRLVAWLPRCFLDDIRFHVRISFPHAGLAERYWQGWCKKGSPFIGRLKDVVSISVLVAVSSQST